MVGRTSTGLRILLVCSVFSLDVWHAGAGRAAEAADDAKARDPRSHDIGAHESGAGPHVEHVQVVRRQAAGTQAAYDKATADLGPLGTRRTLDAPFSILAVPQDVIVNQQGRNINDVMQYLPSVQLEERGDPNTSRPQSRGFEADVVSNMRIDGLNAVTTTPYAAEQFDNLQVLNGLAGALYGPQNPAGTFAYTLKRPTGQRVNRLSVGVDSIGTVMENADLSGRAGRNGWFGYRLNLLHGDGTGYVDKSWLRRNLVSGDFDIRLSERTVIEIDASQYTYAERGMAPGFAYSATVPLPAAPDLSKPYLGQDYAGFNMETNTALAKIRHEFNEDWSLTLGGLYQNAYRQVFANTDRLLNGAGLYQQVISAATTAKNFKVGSNLAYLNGHVRTWSIGHDLVVGTNGYMMGNYNPTRADGTFVLGTASLDDPRSFPGRQPYFSGTYESAYTRTQTVILGDTLHLDRHWSVMGTLGWGWMSIVNNDVHGHVASAYDKDAAFSPMTSLIYQPAKNQTAYFTWGRSLQQGDTAPAGSTNQNQVLAPLKSEEYEVGYKILVGKLQMNVAGFRMTRPYSFTDPTTRLFGTFGVQRNYGVEFQAAGSVTPDLSVLGGVTWIDAQLGATGTPATSHKEVVGVAPVQADILLDYRLPLGAGVPGRGLAVNANVHYTGRRAANVANTSFAGSYVTLDLGARYAFRVAHYPMVVRFGVQNVTGARYWASVYPSSINGGGSATNNAVAGLPRTCHFTLSAEF